MINRKIFEQNINLADLISKTRLRTQYLQSDDGKSLNGKSLNKINRKIFEQNINLADLIDQQENL